MDKGRPGRAALLLCRGPPQPGRGRCANSEGDAVLHLKRLVTLAAADGHSGAVSVLLKFALRGAINPSDIITRYAMDIAIDRGHAATVEAMVTANTLLIMRSGWVRPKSLPFSSSLAPTLRRRSWEYILATEAAATEALFCPLLPGLMRLEWLSCCWIAVFRFPGREHCIMHRTTAIGLQTPYACCSSGARTSTNDFRQIPYPDHFSQSC